MCWRTERFETRHRRKDGTIITVEVSAHSLDFDGGVIFSFLRDISEVSRLEARLRQSQKMEAIGTLAGGIAHDFNNVLHAMLGYADLALDDMSKESKQYGWLKQIQEAGVRASKLVNQILAFSRERKVERSPIEVHVVVEEVMDFLRGTLPATIDISCLADPACLPVIADATEIHQVLMNLCTNSYHAMPDKIGRLEVTLRQIEVTSAGEAKRLGIAPGRYAQIIVRDNGTGMDVLTLERAFDPYFTTKPVGEGTGMGLATVHGIVQSMQGAIVAESMLGQGSTIKVFLPVVAGGRVEFAERGGEDATISGNETVLFVDDEEMITRLGQTILRKHGYGVSVFTNPAEALADFTATPEKYDIVITDQTMPGMTGLELTRAVRALRPEMPIILCTGNPAGVEDAADDAAALPEVLAKPLGPDQLVRAIRMALRTETTGDAD